MKAHEQLKMHDKMQQEFINVHTRITYSDSTYSWHDRPYSFKRRTYE